MKCIRCQGEVEAGVGTCPACGENLEQWLGFNRLSDEFLNEGLIEAGKGNRLLAALSLAKATFLNPRNSRAFKALGQVLASSGEYERAAHCFARCEHLAMEAGAALDEATAAAKAKVEEALAGEAGNAPAEGEQECAPEDEATGNQEEQEPPPEKEPAGKAED